MIHRVSYKMHHRVANLLYDRFIQLRFLSLDFKVNLFADECGSWDPSNFSDGDCWTTDGNTCHLVLEGVVSVEKDVLPADANGVILRQNTPNPFKPATTISYSTGQYTSGNFKIYSPNGKMVYSAAVKGNGDISWNAGDLASGIYVCRLQAGSQVVSKRMLLMK